MEIVHTLNRGVDKRIIFLDDWDRFRFIHNLYEFNDQDRVEARNIFHKHSKSGFSDIASQKVERKKRKLLVNIHCFCLMPNHYHLLLSPRVKDGISKFMKKLNMGYAKYFNQKYKRTGALFEGRYKAVPVIDEAHFIHLPYYIHLNPLDLVAPEWRNRTMRNPQKAIKFLENYRWSSFLDYIGKKNFPSVTSRSLFSRFFGGSISYKTETIEWIRDMDLTKIKNIILD